MLDWIDTMGALSRIAFLAGGQSRRMGENKANMVFEGSSQIQRLVEDARLMGLSVVLAGGCLDYPSVKGRVTLCDDYLDPFEGPLSAMKSALEYAYHQGDEWLWVYAVDTLLCPSELWHYLRVQEACQSNDIDIVLPKAQKTLPLSGIYRTALYADLQVYLDQGERRVMKWIQRHRVSEVLLPQALHRCVNFNTRSEFIEAQKCYLAYHQRDKGLKKIKG